MEVFSSFSEIFFEFYLRITFFFLAWPTRSGFLKSIPETLLARFDRKRAALLAEETGREEGEGAAADGKRPKQPPAEETVGGVERYPNFKNCQV